MIKQKRYGLLPMKANRIMDIDSALKMPRNRFGSCGDQPAAEPGLQDYGLHEVQIRRRQKRAKGQKATNDSHNQGNQDASDD